MEKELEHLTTANVMLRGYFQSYKYFADVQKELREEFTFADDIPNVVSDYFTRVAPDEWNEKPFVRVGIDVRRGSMISESRQKKGDIPPPPSYFNHAMDYFRKRHDRVQFIVASTDLAWCRENILGDHVEYSTHNYTVDLAILSMSDHVIISLGTYSWWAGWLNKGTTL